MRDQLRIILFAGQFVRQSVPGLWFRIRVFQFWIRILNSEFQYYTVVLLRLLCRIFWCHEKPIVICSQMQISIIYLFRRYTFTMFIVKQVIQPAIWMFNTIIHTHGSYRLFQWNRWDVECGCNRSRYLPLTKLKRRFSLILLHWLVYRHFNWLWIMSCNITNMGSILTCTILSNPKGRAHIHM